MRISLVVSLLAVASLSLGCKDKPTKKAPPANVGSGQGSGPRAAPDLILPRADGTPPKKTAVPHAKADYERMAKLEFPGFGQEVRTVGEKVFEVRHKTKDHPRLWAVVTIKHCFECLPMELDKWKAKEQELKAINLEALKDSKDIDWELGETTLNGQKIIYAYQVGTGTAPGEGGGEYSFTNSFLAYFNDGINEIRVVGTYKDDPVDKASLKRLAPKEDLRALALSFMDVYTHAW
ncbi:MAG TPA: hypothetical protein VIV11_21855 [Kofleriaceae bacterium]